MKKVTPVLLLLLCISASIFAQDFQILNVQSPLIFDQYPPAQFSFDITNSGIVAVTENTLVTAKLSTDNAVGDDIYLGSVLISPLSSNQSKSYSISSDGGLMMPPGSYFLLLTADNNKTVEETDETNNIFTIPGFVINTASIDYQVTQLSAPPKIAKFDAFAPTYEVKNFGTFNTTGSYYTTFYISSDNILDAGDTKLESFYKNFNGENTIQGDAWNLVQIPNIATGHYYLIGKADVDPQGNSLFDETDENNNTRATSIEIIESDIDLDISNSIIHAAYVDITGMAHIEIRYDISNTGTTGTINYLYDVYVSEDNQFDASDVKISSYIARHNSYYIAGNGTSSHSVMAYLDEFGHWPNVPGTKYVILALNQDHAITETDYTDNMAVASSTIDIPVRNPIIRFDDLKLKDTYDNRDRSYDIEVTFKNVGTNGQTSDVYYLAIYDAVSQQQVSETSHFEFLMLNAGETKTVSWTHNLEQPLPEGSYNVVVRDSYNSTQATTSLTILQSPSALMGVVKGEDGTVLSKGKLFLYQKQHDGKIAFIEKIDPYQGETFNFGIDTHAHTLYFIPDPTLFPDYVPTVYGKTVDLRSTSFFTQSDDTEIVFEVLKLQPLPAGTKVISGNVQEQNPAGRRGTNTIQSIAVINISLLNENQQIVGTTETDANGNFEFTNLPEGVYQVVIGGATESSLSTTTLDVDLTQNNVEIIVTDLLGDVQETVKLKPTITFENFDVATYGDDPVQIVASSDAPVTLSYVSTNTAVAIIENGYINIVGAGTTEIKAISEGNDTYAHVVSIQTLTINKAAQSIAFTPFEEITAPDDIELSATSSSGLDVLYSSNHPEIASIQGNVVKIHSAGVVEITASQIGNENYLAAADVKQTLVVSILDVEGVLASVTVYPNPSNGKLTISRESGQMIFSITNLLGKREMVTVNENILDITSLSPGLYLLTVQEGTSKKIIKIIRN
ncbi:CARDB domain-containing protein [Pseudochryseolinea flava]|nr:CARDB domain-containing protein [Pseudochryseolinea flava]